MREESKEMETTRNIRTYNSYEICKKFHLLVPYLSNYLVKVVGVDHDKKHDRQPKRIRHGKIMHERMSRRLSHLFHSFLVRKKKNKRKSTRSKKRNHEYAKSV